MVSRACTWLSHSLIFASSHMFKGLFLQFEVYIYFRFVGSNALRNELFTKEEVYSAFSRLNRYSSQDGKHKHFNQLMYTYILFWFIFVNREQKYSNLTSWQKSHLEHKNPSTRHAWYRIVQDRN
jgi:hypothetical protein